MHRRLRRQLDEYTHTRALIEIPTVVALASTATGSRWRRCGRTPGRSSPPRWRATLIAYVGGGHPLHLGLLALAGNAHLVEVVARPAGALPLYGLTALVEAGRTAQPSPRSTGAAGTPCWSATEKAVHAIMTHGIWVMCAACGRRD
ncbi:hypothetical protein GCM10017687_81060 [Streptomyces echinatus]|uniref:hypothetical protein n=1 Tax=Streptomyces echinatus TaxID=67293 RepID=UPI003389A50A